MFGNEKKIEDLDLDEFVFVVKRELNRRIDEGDVEFYDLFVRSKTGAHYTRQNARFVPHIYFLNLIEELRDHAWNWFGGFYNNLKREWFDRGLRASLEEGEE